MKEIDTFLGIVQRLRRECPWDKVQTHQSLAKYALEEAYETVHAIALEDTQNLREELGDLLLQIVLHSVIAEENSKTPFSFADVVAGISAKMVERHPEIFQGDCIPTSEQHLANWEMRKPKKSVENLLSHSPKFPAVVQALSISKLAAQYGFDWPNTDGVLHKLQEEIAELNAAISKKEPERSQIDINEELGDILFTVVNLARKLKADPELVLLNANLKFAKRFESMLFHAKSQGLDIAGLSIDGWEQLWSKAKGHTPRSSP